MSKFYIYKITNIINNKIYIGKTNNINNRFKKHKIAAIKKYKNDFSYLHKAMNKYGAENFIIEKIEETDSEEISFEREKFWIKQLKSRDKNIGYNLTDGGDGPIGYKMTKDHKVNISKSKTGKKLSEKHKLSISNSLKGVKNPFFNKKHSLESKKKISISRIGKKNSIETRKKISKAIFGEKHYKAKLSENEVIKIRSLYKNGYTVSQLVKQFNSTFGNIDSIVKNKSWKHLLRDENE